MTHKKGLPEGHAHVEREMVVPVFTGNVIKAILGVGNKETDYTSEDTEVLSLIANLTWEIVERKTAYNELSIAKAKAEQNFIKMTEVQALAKTGSWELDVVNNKLTWSDEVYRLFGCQPQELKASYEGFLGFSHPEDRKKVDEAYSGSLRDGVNTYEIEHRIIRPNTGEVRHVHERCVHFLSNTGKVIQSIGMVQDITDRIIAEEQILQSEKKYKTLFFDSPEAFLIIENGVYIECNTASEKLIGSSRSDIIGKTPHELSPEYQLNGRRSDEYAKALIEETFAGQRSAFEWMHTRKDGTEFLAQINLTVIEYDRGPALLVNWQDITELRRAEDQLRKLWSAVDQSPVSIMITDLDGKIEYFNPAACWMTGYSHNEMIGKNPRIFQSGETNRSIYKGLWKTITSGKVWHGEFRNRRKSGELYLESCTISPVKDSSGAISHFIGIKEDITERKRMQEEIVINELRHRLVASKSRSVIWEVDLNGLYTYVSEVSSDVYGYKPEELIQKRYFYDLHPEEMRDRFKETGLESIKRGKEINDFDNPIETKEGRIIWVSTNGTPIIDEDGRLVGFRDSDIDITNKKKIEAEILDMNANLEKKISERTDELQTAICEISDLYENAPCGYHSVDSSGNIVRINSTELSWLGYTKEEIVGKKHITDILSSESKEIFMNVFPVFKKNGTINDIELELIRKMEQNLLSH
ncbi:MAG: PAS domain S-box protein [Bacteroidetes bacterium]|nr:PAS domain S-box protein [Bacteroidota bacterium]